MLITNHNLDDAAMNNDGHTNHARTKTPYALFYLVAFSAVVTYFYDSALGLGQYKREKNALRFDEFRPTKAQLSRARNLGIPEKRVSQNTLLHAYCMISDRFTLRSIAHDARTSR